MKALRKIQDKWGNSEAGAAVLKTVFGKTHRWPIRSKRRRCWAPLMNPETRNKLAERAVVGMCSMDGATRAIHRGHGRLAVEHLFTSRRWPQLIAALGTAALGGHIMARMSPQATELYSKMLLNPSPETMRTFSRVAGATLTGMEAQPNVP